MRPITVADVMSRKVGCVPPETPFKHAARMMARLRVSGLPVTDPEGRLVGIVTEADLLRSEVDEREPRPRSAFLEWFIDRDRLERIERRAEDQRVADVMTREVITVRPETTVYEAVKHLVDAGVKTMPVVDDLGKVVGIVTRSDLLQPYLRTDQDIRREIEDEVVYRTMWLDPDTIRVTVERGVVSLAGQLDLRSAKEILVALVHRVDGVVGVEDHLTYEMDDRDLKPDLRPFPLGVTGGR